MRFHYLIAATALGAIALAACGSGSSQYSSSPSTTPTTTQITTTRAAAVSTGNTSLGPVLVDAGGHTLYGLTKDVNGMPTCAGACASEWPPAVVDGTQLPAGLDAKVFSVVARPDGTHQLRAGKWPLYRFAGDTKAGETNGQGTGGVWFAVAPTAKLDKAGAITTPPTTAAVSMDYGY
jgi:predicted lipoprotein with Yx(FWY)xxD motif